MQAKQCVIVLDFGGQYNQLIARRVRENHVYCEVKPCTTPLAELMKHQPIGFIFTGGPQSVYAEGSPKVDPAIFELGLPILGICYGCQLIAITSAARSRLRRRIPRGNTEKRRRSLTRAASCSMV